MRRYALAALVLLVSLVGAPAAAGGYGHDDPSFAPTCHAASGLETTVGAMAQAIGHRAGDGAGNRDTWTCSDTDWAANQPVAWLLFDAEAWQSKAAPRFFFSRIARHRNVTFTAIDRDGSRRSVAWDEADGAPFALGPVFRLALPEITPDTRALIARIERPHSVPLLTEARLVHHSDNADWSQLHVILVAFVVGMLVLPLFFDISFFIVLRERFVLLHAAMVIFMMGYVLTAGGLISAFPYFSLRTIAVAGPLLWALGIGTSALFLAAFLEKGAQSTLMRRVTIALGVWSMIVPGFFALQLHATQSFDDPGYFYTFVPMIVLITAAVAEAVLRGSRSARFIAVAWTPIILASIERLLRGIGLYVGPSALDLSIYVATGFEVVVISLAIADRFLAIRRERDEAVTEARMLERLSTRDALTGLLNRRGLEMTFDEFIERGFDTFALIDLDRFKQINDTHGHQKGDAALIACARALQANHDPDLVAVRLGGEEFIVLLRGKRTLERAEALRKAIPLRIAADVEGLSAPVTASSGVIEVPRASNTLMDFEQLYARADALMYEAKATGRNRMLYERLTVFADAPPPRPASDCRECSGRRDAPRTQKSKVA